MKLTVLQAPSPSVLSFLRAQVKNAFEQPAVQCAGLRRQRCTYTTNVREGYPRQRPRRACVSTTQAVRTTSSRIFGQQCKTLHAVLDKTPQHGITLRSLDRTIKPALGCRAFSSSRPQNVWDVFKTARKRKLAQLQAPTPPSE